MDAILELAECFAIECTTMKIRPKRKTIPSNNPDAFCNIVRPILEGQKIYREEVCSLPCHVSHEIKPQSTRVKESDNLYAIFASQTQQSPYFLRKWLRTFMQSHKTYFEKCGQFYLSTFPFTFIKIAQFPYVFWYHLIVFIKTKYLRPLFSSY